MKIIKSFFSIIFIFVLWEVLAGFSYIDNSFFPEPTLIIKRVYLLLGDSEFLNDLTYSMKRYFTSAIIAIPSAYILALTVAHSKLIDNFINPLIALTFPLPKVAIFPLLLLIFGIDDGSKIAMISIGMFYLMFINVREGTINLLNSTYMDIIKIYKISGFNYLYQFLFKGSLHFFLIGLLGSLNYGLTLVVVSEFNLSKNGIGNFIWRAWDQFRIVDMYAGILILSCIGFCIYTILDVILQKHLEITK